jgi:hypothetical protein
MPQFSPAVYDYWSYYLSDRLGHPVSVIDDQDPQARIPAAVASPPLALVAKSFPESRSAFGAVGPLDVPAWEQDRARLLSKDIHIVFLEGHGMRVPAVLAAAKAGTQLRLKPSPDMALRSRDAPVDMDSLRPGP